MGFHEWVWTILALILLGKWLLWLTVEIFSTRGQ
jgi:hypothetical protein